MTPAKVERSNMAAQQLRVNSVERITTTKHPFNDLLQQNL